jgi:ribosomal protein S6
MRPLRLLTIAAVLAAGVSAHSEASVRNLPGATNPDWPCVQRLLPEISAGMIWAGPPLDSVGNGAADQSVARLAEELAARRVPIDEAEAMVEDFAGDLTPEARKEQLVRLFAETLEVINADRSSIIHGIERYTRGQRELAKNIAKRNDAIQALPASDVTGRQRLVAERDWDLRIFNDRRSALTYLCEQPVLLEQRAFALARSIAGQLE